MLLARCGFTARLSWCTYGHVKLAIVTSSETRKDSLRLLSMEKKESLTGDESPPMTSNVTIRVDEPESDEKGNGHVSSLHVFYRLLEVICCD
ncbi:hypothetical protein NECAME_06925 [Necator americanus]|uniref:Uncharacterized protein n=1 Tax=Necator americanus TaxID=51031 RepID=W2TTC2_NECAM|nr:hypothetical protein NECAME_06925 [Necator americanus]ETN84292.1 hypothetical protein NECAME_06925 [Necator americanus]